jgi:hypothetical protein
MKKLLPIFVVLILLAGGVGVAGYLGLLAKESPAAGAEPGSAELVEMDTLVMSIIAHGSLKAHLSFAVTLEVYDERARIKVQRRELALRDAFIKDMHALLPLKQDQPGFVQGEYVRQRLLRIAERLLGPGQVRAIRVHSLSRRDLSQKTGA